MLSGSSSGGVYVDQQTTASAQQAANKVKARQDVQRLFNEAKPQIEKMTAFVACGATNKNISKYSDPDAVGFVSPFIHFNYHKSGCLNILRINGIEKRTANAFAFKVTYVSPQSEESKIKEYTAIKQPSGEWLFKWSYY
ncbi:hypothetical protein A4G18_04840 [Pasteurellaceae bacterium Pebbles2]|nr:hypothetical protein [Pasteurellaceae bacterium Pebbles2]